MDQTALAKRFLDGLITSRFPARRFDTFPPFSDVEGDARALARRVVRALATRGFENERHCLRVAAWSMRLAKALGLSAARTFDVEIGALLHDIGMTCMPDDALTSARPLTDAEVGVLRTHCDVGAEHLAGEPLLRGALDTIRCHHERFDGTGYPRGLMRNAIPLGARIFQIADTYDAIVTGRPYKPGGDHAQAKNEMARHLGTQFDPEIFRIFALIHRDDWTEAVSGLAKEGAQAA